MTNGNNGLEAVCRCGATALRATGAPITVATCHCASCKAAAERFEHELNAAPVIGSDGGIDYALFRKDRVDVVRGREHLEEHRITADSSTRRVVAACCSSPLFLDFTPGHWVSLYRASLTGKPPAPELQAHTTKFLLKLLSTWAAMGFRRPKLAF